MRPFRLRSRPAVALVATLTVAAGAVLANTVSAQAAGGCRITYTVQSQWTGGFVANVDVANLGAPLTSWQVAWSFTAGQQVTQLWNGTVNQSGALVTVANTSWNGNIATGATTSFGFGATVNGTSNPVPTAFTLNGIACNGGVDPTPTGSSPSPSPSTSPSPTASTTPAPAASILDQVHTVGRLKTTDASVQYTWPGTYFEGRFRGTGVGLVINDSTNDYVVAVDGTTVATLVTPGQVTHWVRDLANGDHTVRLAKRTESPWAAGEFGGLVPVDGGAILAKPAARSRQIEFIGDSWTAGYGDISTSRDCAGTGVTRNSNADAAFGALTARGLNADYQINAWSGMGMVRNYNGQTPDTTFRTYYDTDLQALWNSTVWPVPSAWKPQVVVIGLGINDFSTPPNAGEKWANFDELAADYQAAYLAFINKLRTRYGAGAEIVLTYPDLSYLTTALADSIQQIVKTRNDGGDARVSSLYYDNNALGLDLLGCDWHPSQHDHQILAATLTRHLATLPITW
ncbi:cellulose binding domain-containing protein [Actinoplanes awajinensis]|uniref:cellulose binding domain-containing protein n=1 Tax=Actinoplanes awajinensis TaxID=135946 RepID=UPI000A05974C|nr:cellulose binding domain-containing protein [Actinoplanes awajinensis]